MPLKKAAEQRNICSRSLINDFKAAEQRNINKICHIKFYQTTIFLNK